MASLSVIRHLIAYLTLTDGVTHACDYDTFESTPLMRDCAPFLYSTNQEGKYSKHLILKANCFRFSLVLSPLQVSRELKQPLPQGIPHLTHIKHIKRNVITVGSLQLERK